MCGSFDREFMGRADGGWGGHSNLIYTRARAGARAPYGRARAVMVMFSRCARRTDVPGNLSLFRQIVGT